MARECDSPTPLTPFLIRASPPHSCAAHSSHSPSHPRIPTALMRSPLLALPFSSRIPTALMRSPLLSLPFSSVHPHRTHAQPTPLTPFLIRASPPHSCAAHSSHSPSHPHIPTALMRSPLLTLPFSSAHPHRTHAQPTPLTPLLIRASPPHSCAAHSSHSPSHPRIPTTLMRIPLLSLPFSSRIPTALMRSPLLSLPFSSAHPPRTHAQPTPLTPLLIRASPPHSCAAHSSHPPSHPRILIALMLSPLISLPFSSAHPHCTHAHPTLPTRVRIRASNAHTLMAFNGIFAAHDFASLSVIHA
ncbi:unnamed protein product [Closterium sp. NIES-64]|nr:unnamed protein product [Closterium sp. NIES-64]